MPDYQPIDYRLRCHTKRTDLPADVLRDIGEAYMEITRLQRERDEARREICMIMGGKGGRSSHISPDAIDYAKSRGWDCFRDYDKANEALDRLSELDQELGLFDLPRTNE